MKLFDTFSLSAVLLAIIITGCSNAEQASINGWGKRHVVKQYSGGILVGQWETTGKVENEDHSDGYYFQDEKTGRFVTVSGNIQITVE